MPAARSIGRLQIGAVACEIDWGAWDETSLSALIRDVRKEPDPGRRVFKAAQAFLGTPFEFECRLRPSDERRFRIRLGSFDCATFVYTMIALGAASSFEDFAAHLLRLRFLTELTEPDGAIARLRHELDITAEVLAYRATDLGLLADVTQKAFSMQRLHRRIGPIRPQRRRRAFDPERRLIRPRYASGRVLEVALLDEAAAFAPGPIRTGDIVLLTRALTEDAPFDCDHVVIADADGSDVLFIHATRHYNHAPGSADHLRYSRFFYYGDKTREQLGVAYGSVSVMPRQSIWVAGLRCDAHHGDRKRSLNDYASDNFAATVVLRPCCAF